MPNHIILDFDGVLFDSAFEAYQVCQKVTTSIPNLRKNVDYEEFLQFRKYLTDAWQFNRLYSKFSTINDFTKLHEILPDEEDMNFTQSFFKARKIIMENNEWDKLMIPYKFFFEIKEYIVKHPSLFKILSTRNEESITRTLNHNGIHNIQIAGQEIIRKYSSKLNTAKVLGWVGFKDSFSVFIDDMPDHLVPFKQDVDLLLHADWGYGEANENSCSSDLCSSIIKLLCKSQSQ
jgi:hypothetical protein